MWVSVALALSPFMERAVGRTAKSGSAAARYAPHSSCRRWPDHAVSCASQVRALCAVHIALSSRSPHCFGGRAVRRRLGPLLEFGGDLTGSLGERVFLGTESV